MNMLCGKNENFGGMSLPGGESVLFQLKAAKEMDGEA